MTLLRRKARPRKGSKVGTRIRVVFRSDRCFRLCLPRASSFLRLCVSCDRATACFWAACTPYEATKASHVFARLRFIASALSIAPPACDGACASQQHPNTRLPAPLRSQILAPLPAGAPTLLPVGFSVLLAAHHFILAQIARHPTQWLLTLAIVAVAARTALASVFCRFAPAPRPDEAVPRAERRRRQWQIAACEAAGTVLLVFVARSNPVWVWAGTDVRSLPLRALIRMLTGSSEHQLLVPLLALVFDPSAGVANRPSMLRVTLVSSAASFVAVWIWRTEYPIVEGIVLALLAAAVQAARRALVLREAESRAESDWASLARSQRDTGLVSRPFHIQLAA